MILKKIYFLILKEKLKNVNYKKKKEKGKAKDN